MARLAQGRSTYLTSEEIAAEALRQFDTEGSMSIRSLAATLGTAPASIYYYYPSYAAIVDAVILLAWEDARTEAFRLLEDPSTALPEDVLVATGLGTRRAFLQHHQLAPRLAAAPSAVAALLAGAEVLAGVFESLGLSGPDAAAAFHSFGSYVIGSSLVAAARHGSDVRTEADDAGADDDAAADQPAAGPATTTLAQIREIVTLSYSDPERDEELFVIGLRRMIASFRALPG